MSAPVLSSPNLPRQVKIAFVLTLGVLIFPQVNIPNTFSFSNHWIIYILFLIKEVGLGLILGYAIRLLFVGVELAGQIIGLQMGLSMAEFIDPESSEQVPVISQFKNLLALMVFIGINAHYAFLKATVDSFKLVPLGSFIISPPFVKTVVKMTGDVFVLALKAGTPIILTLLIIQIIMGVINRIIPQINIFMISLPLKIGVGLVVIGLSVPYLVHFLEGTFGGIYRSLILLLRIGAG